MRIAICISGQVRTWEKCVDTLFNLIDRMKQKLNADVDIFCHAWDFNTPLNRNALTADTFLEPTGIVLLEGELTRLFNKLTPKSVLIENEVTSISRVNEILQRGFRHNEYYGNCAINSEASQFYSIMRSAHLKKQYEFINNFRYDLCIRLRYDLFFDKHQCDVYEEFDLSKSKYNTVYPCHTAIDQSQFPYYRMGDILWQADSITFDRICNFYKWLPILGTKCFNKGEISTEHSLFLYAKMFKISVIPLVVDPKICRMHNDVAYLHNAPVLDNLEKYEFI